MWPRIILRDAFHTRRDGMFRDWRRQKASRAPKRAAWGYGAPRGHSRIRLRVEVLEDRTLPSVFSVNSLGDTGSGSGTSGDLRYCLTQAQMDSTDTTIQFAVSGTITLEHALPDLRKLAGSGSLLDIEGGGAVTVQRDPAATTPLFSVF